MTTTAPPSGLSEQSSVPPPRRRLRGRITSGHMLMIVAALTAAIFNYAFLQSADQREQVSVLRAPVTAGQVLAPVDFTTAGIAASGEVLEALVRPEDLEGITGAIAGVDLPANMPVRHDELRAAAASDGRRAMSIPIDVSRAVGGALTPGDRVDVIATGEGQARYLLTDTEVLDVSGNPAGQGLDQLGSFSLTVAVEAENALGLAHALSEGALDVVRSTGADPVNVETAHD